MGCSHPRCGERRDEALRHPAGHPAGSRWGAQPGTRRDGGRQAAQAARVPAHRSRPRRSRREVRRSMGREAPAIWDQALRPGRVSDQGHLPARGRRLGPLSREGPNLWFVHGTFSTSHGGFYQIPPEMLGEPQREVPRPCGGLRSPVAVGGPAGQRRRAEQPHPRRCRVGGGPRRSQPRRIRGPRHRRRTRWPTSRVAGAPCGAGGDAEPRHTAGRPRAHDRSSSTGSPPGST